jgi:hypothetical protein
MGGTLTRSQAWRASNRLSSQGVLHVRVYPRAWTEYHIDHVTLADLLSRGATHLRALTCAITNPIRLPDDAAAAVSMASHASAASPATAERSGGIHEPPSPDQPLEESR